ncbi:MAG: TonB-dependent receptor, partial [Myxococcales bacterium]|nr:TonB-dependent receptor [Myxococcales bacterium]
LAAHLEHDGDDGSVTEAGLWVGTFNFRSKLNFTGYTRRSTFDPAWIGRGDLIEQHNADLALGFHARYRTPTYEPVEWAKGSIEFGLSTRVDNIDQQQNLLESPQNQTWDQLVDASITGADVGAWVDAHVDLTKYVQLHGGVRADALFYDVEDALGNFIPAIRRESYIVGFRRNAFGLAAGPRVSVTVAPVEWMKLIAAYGQGFRSPQARQLQDGETAPYTKVHSGDLGARFSFGRNEELTLTTAAYLTKLSDDVAFEPAEARVERIGPTTRVGGVFYATARPWRGWLSSLSVTYVHATLDAPPPATADNPTPAFQDGQLLPYVPPWVVRLDSKVEEPLFSLGDDAVYGSIGAGVSYLSPRPLPFSEFADPVALVDASMGARWRNLELNIEAYNLFNSSYAASEYSFVSNWDPGAAPSRLPARHVAAGAPFTLLASLGVRL